MKPSLPIAFALVAPLLASACAGPRAAAPPPRSLPAPVAAAAAPAPVLPFIEDDYPRALAEARASKKPIFVDGWAPW